MYFETATRNDGTEYTTTTEDCPEWLKDAVHRSHGIDTPNDWIYDECDAAVAGDIADSDSLHDYADARVDIYTRCIYQWAADMVGSDVYCTAESEAIDLCSDSTSINRCHNKRSAVRYLQQTIQYCAIYAIASTILTAYLENKS